MHIRQLPLEAAPLQSLTRLILGHALSQKLTLLTFSFDNAKRRVDLNLAKPELLEAIHILSEDMAGLYTLLSNMIAARV